MKKVVQFTVYGNTATFLNLNPLGQIILCCGGYPVHCRVFTVSPELCTPTVATKSLQMSNVFGGKITILENQGYRGCKQFIVVGYRETAFSIAGGTSLCSKLPVVDPSCLKVGCGESEFYVIMSPVVGYISQWVLKH